MLETYFVYEPLIELFIKKIVRYYRGTRFEDHIGALRAKILNSLAYSSNNRYKYFIQIYTLYTSVVYFSSQKLNTRCKLTVTA